MKAARLARMSLPELAGRSRQELWKRLERSGLGSRASDPWLGVFGRLARDPALAAIRERAATGDHEGAARRLFERWSAAFPERFFGGASEGAVPALVAERWPAERERIVAEAAALRAGRFDLLGYRGLSFGDPIDWQLDPLSGRSAPLEHWSRVDPLDGERVGDHKLVWELNRHQWLVTLGQAYRLTGDEVYAKAFASSVLAWIAENPPGRGINWASSLEAALRLIAWSWALALFRGSRALTPALFALMLESVDAHAAHVERYLSYHFSPNTHLTGEALGLCYAGWLYPELARAHRWRRLGWRILVDECARQVQDDGMHFELSTCYQRYTAEIYLHAVGLAAANGPDVPAAVTDRLGRMMDALLALSRPDGSVPAIGDADGGWLLPLSRRAPGDLRGLFAIAAAVCGRADCAWAAEGASPESLWMLGAAGVAAVDALPAAPPEGPTVRHLEASGYVVMRSGWDRRAHQLVFDAGPLGCPVSAGHGHADLLSIQCAVFGEPFLVDPGTYRYADDDGWRDFFRGTAAHSTVVVDGAGQALPRGPFGWQARPAARLTGFRRADGRVVAQAEHDAYRRLADPVTHRRRVIWAMPLGWMIVDALDGAAEHDVELGFQWAPIEVRLGPDLWARARGAGGQGLLVRPFAAVPLAAEIRCGETAPPRGWVSRDYGHREPAPALVYSARARLPLTIASLLYPVADARAPVPDVSAVFRGTEPVALTWSGGRERVDLTW